MPEQVEIELNVNGGQQAAQSVGNIKKELKAAQAAALAMSRQFGELSPQAQAAARRVAELRDEMADLNERVALFDPGKRFAVLGNAVQTVTAGFTAAQGAMALFGSESADLQKQLVKVQGALALTQGLSAISDSWKDFQRLGVVIRTQVVTAFSTLRGAIAATGIGLLVIAIAALVANFEKVEAAVKKLFPAFEGFGKLFDKVKATAMGALNGIIESLKVVGEIVTDLFTGDFSGAVKTANEAGSRIGAAYVQGFEAEVKDQIAESARKSTEALIKVQENQLKVLKAYGATREREADALEMQIAQNKVKILKDGTKEERQAQAAAFADLEAMRIQQAQKEGQRALKILQDRQALELQAITDSGRSVIGVRLSQLQEQLALEKQYGLDTRGTLQEIAQQYQSDRKGRFDKELKAMQLQQDMEYAAAQISGKNILHLKEDQLKQQLALYKKFGYSVKDVEQQIVSDTIEQRKKLNDALAKNADDGNRKVLSDLQNTTQAQDILNQKNAEAAAKGGIAVDEAEKKKQKALEFTDYYLNLVSQDTETKTELETALSAAGALAMELGELKKQDALTATMNALHLATAVMGKQTGVGKAVAIASTTVDAISGAAKSYTSLAPIPIVGPALGAVAAAAALVAGYARVKAIQNVKIPGADGIGAPPMPSAPTMPRVQSDTGTMVDQLAQVNSNMRQATRVQVVESDITNAQKRVEVIENNAKF
jgi:hypothetical protein